MADPRGAGSLPRASRRHDACCETRDLAAFYGDFQALFGIDLRIEEGETVAIIGANGAGKSTLLRTITGLLRAPAELRAL